MKTKWNLSLIYKNDTDPKMALDTKKIQEKAGKFKKRYYAKNIWPLNEKAILSALNEYDELLAELGSFKPLMYFHYKQALDSSDTSTSSKIAYFTEIANKSWNEIVFFRLRLSKLSKAQRLVYLKSEKLSEFKYFLTQVFESSTHDLEEGEEKILNLKSRSSRTLWIEATEKFLHSREVIMMGKKVPVTDAQSSLSTLPRSERIKTNAELTKCYKEVAEFAEMEINAIFSDKKINDELRGYKEPFSATLLSYQNSERTVKSLIGAVTTRFKISHDFYKQKAKVLGLERLNIEDRSASIGNVTRTFTFSESVKITRSAFRKVSPEFEKIFVDMLEAGQIDVLPKKGKTGGAFCSSGSTTPTYVLLNHTNNLRSLMTLAHEMGHAIHAHYSKKQKISMYDGHSIATAEIASTLFENFVFDEVMEKLSESERKIAKHDRLNDSMSTIFRQIACFNFEVDIHSAIRKEGFVSKESLSILMNKHLSSYLGPTFKLRDDDGYFWVTWSHIRNYFYVYTYAFGALVSNVLYSEYKRDKNFLDKIVTFLEAGESNTPEEILKSIGIDVSSPKFFIKGLDKVAQDLATLKQ